MSELPILERFDSYFEGLETALRVPESRKREILDEIRGDLRNQIHDLRESGKSESEAVDLVLAEMGDPALLGHQLSETVAPFSTGPVRVIRYLAAGGLIVWSLLLLWTFRAWNYGFSPLVTLGFLGFHLSLILVIWPGIVWKKNWLFGLLPAGVALGLLMVTTLLGASTASTSIEISLDGEISAPIPTTPEPYRPPPEATVFLGGSALLLGVLFILMQQSRQRKFAMVAAAITFLGIEGAFFLEERQFRKERDRLQELTTSGVSEFPGETKRPGVRINVSPEGDAFSLHWSRPLSSGFSICYSSESDRIWIND